MGRLFHIKSPAILSLTSAVMSLLEEQKGKITDKGKITERQNYRSIDLDIRYRLDIDI